MRMPGSDERRLDADDTPLYHWAEWPLTVLTAVLLAVALWLGPEGDGRKVVLAFWFSILVLGGWSTYLDWRRGGLSHGITEIHEGFKSGESTFLRMRRRQPLTSVYLAMMALGWWHF